MTAVLRHLAKHRPDWQIDYVADVGKHSAAIGLVHHVWTYEEFNAAREAAAWIEYDRECVIHLYDTFAAWPDRPNTRVTSCLHEKFGMTWDPECARYQILIEEHAMRDALKFLYATRNVTVQFPQSSDFRFRTRHDTVCVHYQGDSSPSEKNLTDSQASSICAGIQELGRTPLLLDWRGKSPICSSGGIRSVAHYPIPRSEWGRDAQMNAAIISQCEAFVGIDSGPSKCASATDTPSLVIWTGHHPALYHDPAPNTTHLIPHDWRQNQLLCGNEAVCDFFAANYNWRAYAPGVLELEAKSWLREVLK